MFSSSRPRSDQFVQVQSEDSEVGHGLTVDKQDGQHNDTAAVIWILNNDAKAMGGHRSAKAADQRLKKLKWIPFTYGHPAGS